MYNCLVYLFTNKTKAISLDMIETIG